MSLSFTIVSVGVLDTLLDGLDAFVDGTGDVAFFFLPNQFMVQMLLQLWREGHRHVFRLVGSGSSVILPLLNWGTSV